MRKFIVFIIMTLVVIMFSQTAYAIAIPEIENDNIALPEYSVEFCYVSDNVASAAVSTANRASESIRLEDEKAINAYFSLLDANTPNKSDFKLITKDLGESIKNIKSDATSVSYDGIRNIISVGTPIVLSEIAREDYIHYVPKVVDCHMYLVKVYMDVSQNNSRHFQGNNYQVLICGTEDGMRKVFSAHLPLPHYVAEFEHNFKCADNYFLQRFDNDEFEHIEDSTKDNPVTPSTIPSTIKVLMTSHSAHSPYGRSNQPQGSSVSTVNFKDYCKRVMASEFGYNSYPAAYHRAGALAVRNFAWHRKLTAPTGQYVSFDVYSDSCDQNYNPNLSLRSNNVAGVDYIWNITMYTNTGKLFLSQHLNGTGGAGTGILREDTAYAKAAAGESYQSILHYFYDNSKLNGPNGSSIGIIQLYCRTGSHTYSSAWSYNSTTHYHLCTKNGCEMKNSSSAHTWVYVNPTTMRCSVCKCETSNGSIIAGLNTATEY